MHKNIICNAQFFVLCFCFIVANKGYLFFFFSFFLLGCLFKYLYRVCASLLTCKHNIRKPTKYDLEGYKCCFLH